MAPDRPRLPVRHPPSLVHRWVAPVFGLAGIALLPWTIWLSSSLPTHHRSEHWDLAWSGFDSGLAIAFLLTALAAWRRSLWLEAAAAATGTMLVCDAWFDVMLESRTGLRLAVAQAVLVEVPLAGFCFWLARDAERFVSRVHAILDEVHEFASSDDPSPVD